MVYSLCLGFSSHMALLKKDTCDAWPIYIPICMIQYIFLSHNKRDIVFGHLKLYIYMISDAQIHCLVLYRTERN